MSPLLESLAEHLTFLGYKTVPGSEIPAEPPDEKVPDDVFSADHKTKPIFWVISLDNGAFFRSLFFLSAAAKSDRLGFLEFINSANTWAVLANYYQTDKYLMVGGWFYGDYDKDRFNLFYDRYAADLRLMTQEFSPQASKYLTNPVRA